MYSTHPGGLRHPHSPQNALWPLQPPWCPWMDARTASQCAAKTGASWLHTPTAVNDRCHSTVNTYRQFPLSLRSIPTVGSRWPGVLCASLSWGCFFWPNVSSCLKSNMDLTITSREPMRWDQRLRGRLDESGVTWQTTPCYNMKQTPWTGFLFFIKKLPSNYSHSCVSEWIPHSFLNSFFNFTFKGLFMLEVKYAFKLLWKPTEETLQYHLEPWGQCCAM